MTDINNGGTTNYYDVPPNSVTLNDLIEYKDMPFWQGEIFKATYALIERANRSYDGTSSEERELNKIIYYAKRRLDALKVYRESMEEEKVEVKESKPKEPIPTLLTEEELRNRFIPKPILY